MSTSQFSILRGSPALSQFRLEKLYASLQQSAPNISHIYAEFVHFAFCEPALSDAQQHTLKQILTYGPQATTEAATGELFLVIPRIGTISPWASRATDIAHNCGLSNIKRIERGIAFYVSSDSGEPLSDVDKSALLPLIHDRMTESVFGS